MTKVIYPGSFDPLTLGHLDIIKRAASMFDEVYVGVLVNREKTPLFSLEERVNIINKAICDLPNVKVEAFEGLLWDFCQSKGCNVVVKGLRNSEDFEYENSQAALNSIISKGELETIYLGSRQSLSIVSSTNAKALASLNVDLKEFVPDFVEELLKEKLVK